MTDSARFSWTVLLPVKVLARAKSRLAVLAGDRRRELALALAADTVAAVARLPRGGPGSRGHLRPGGRAAARGARRGRRARRAGRPRRPRPSPDRLGDLGPQETLNAALRHGAAVAARRWPGTGLAALTADLPALRPAELATALRAAGGGGRPARCSCRTRPASAPRCTRSRPAVTSCPLFGGASRARHAASGAAEIDLDDMAGLRRDVDTPEDLQVVLALGAGPQDHRAGGELLADV